MTDYYQIQDSLKNLSDDELQQATQDPGTRLPMILLMTETNRRQRVRADYENEEARRGENRTTVMEDIMGPMGGPPMGGPPMGGPPMGGPPMGGPPPSPDMGGLPGALPGGGAGGGAGGLQAFADGGQVGTMGTASAGPSEYQQGLASILEATKGRRRQARGMSLLEAGLLIGGGTSPHAMQNLALAAPAIGGYRDQMRQIDQDQLGVLGAREDYERNLRADALAAQQAEIERQDKLIEQRQRGRGLDIQQQMADKDVARTSYGKWFLNLPPDQQRMITSLDSSQRSNILTVEDNRLLTRYNEYREEAMKDLEEASRSDESLEALQYDNPLEYKRRADRMAAQKMVRLFTGNPSRFKVITGFDLSEFTAPQQPPSPIKGSTGIVGSPGEGNIQSLVDSAIYAPEE